MSRDKVCFNIASKLYGVICDTNGEMSILVEKTHACCKTAGFSYLHGA